MCKIEEEKEKNSHRKESIIAFGAKRPDTTEIHSKHICFICSFMVKCPSSEFSWILVTASCFSLKAALSHFECAVLALAVDVQIASKAQALSISKILL